MPGLYNSEHALPGGGGGFNSSPQGGPPPPFTYGIHLNSTLKQTKWKEKITKFAVILRMENLPAKFENPTPQLPKNGAESFQNGFHDHHCIPKCFNREVTLSFGSIFQNFQPPGISERVLDLSREAKEGPFSGPLIDSRAILKASKTFQKSE